MPKSPDFAVYAVREREKMQKPIWTRVGAAWLHEDGTGVNIELEAVPINFSGRLVLLPPMSTQTDDVQDC
jgi:hypothetical protein